MYLIQFTWLKYTLCCELLSSDIYWSIGYVGCQYLDLCHTLPVHECGDSNVPQSDLFIPPQFFSLPLWNNLVNSYCGPLMIILNFATYCTGMNFLLFFLPLGTILIFQFRLTSRILLCDSIHLAILTSCHLSTFYIFRVHSQLLVKGM